MGDAFRLLRNLDTLFENAAHLCTQAPLKESSKRRQRRLNRTVISRLSAAACKAPPGFSGTLIGEGRRRSAQQLFLSVQLLAREPTGLCRPGRLRRQPLPWPSPRPRHQVMQPGQRIPAVLLLGAESLGGDHHLAGPCRPPAGQTHEPLPHRGRQPGPVEIQAQLHGARCLVDVLAARTRRADELKAQCCVWNFLHDRQGGGRRQETTRRIQPRPEVASGAHIRRAGGKRPQTLSADQKVERLDSGYSHANGRKELERHAQFEFFHVASRFHAEFADL